MGWVLSSPSITAEQLFPLNHSWTLNGRPIEVPWPPQAPLSRWEGAVGDELRYQISVTLPEKFLPDGFRALLHFGAVDQVAEVFVNGTSVIR